MYNPSHSFDFLKSWFSLCAQSWKVMDTLRSGTQIENQTFLLVWVVLHFPEQKNIPSLLLPIFYILDKGTEKWVRPVSHSPTSIHPWSSRAEAVGEAEGDVHGAFSVGEKKTMRQIETWRITVSFTASSLPATRPVGGMCLK